ncbi:LMBR1 domain-containing protein 2 homolog A-like isoform X1 [Cynara cardunculus var. scolymus]|uniref:LMBR1 domain-containing protein 2 homolog A-like isoform X1 n=1 Tax=Cynara cardunculus var. scolymus TaxID=59895 RepID=UPI000D626A2C|nr:LMBR1 domain-containing protein 2 homolog A-like isoform X1 [Cynara cardunculus var. scolymus]
MWVFYLISLPLTMGMVIFTLRYFAGPDIPRYVLFTVGYTWFCSLSFIILVPADIWTAMSDQNRGGMSFFWSWSYWSTFLLTCRAVVPILQGYEDAGDFTVTERLKTSLHVNLVFYLLVGSVALFGLILLILMHHNWRGGIIGFAMACSNTFGLVTGAFLLGFGLSEIPKGIWINADYITRQKVLSHKVARAALQLDDAHQNLSNAIVVAQATSKQMSKRDPLRPYMNIIDKMLTNMLNEDPSFKPQGGRLGENDMDYDTDEKSMATLRRQLKIAKGEYYRCRSEYMNFVMEALELEDTLKNYERRNATGWKYISSFRPERSGKIGSCLDTIELVWRCILKKQLKKLSAIILGCLTVAILLAEATILPSGVDFSLFSIIINAVQTSGVLVQVVAFIPLMYMCVCTYYSLFKIGRLTFYSLTPSQTSSVSLLMICSQVARYAPPISYNFLNLIRLPRDAQTVFEWRMGKIDDAVPFFGQNFNKIYPLIMVVYTLMVASNFFDRIMSYFGNWKIFRLRNEADDLDGFDPSGLMILQKERSSIGKGHKVGELVIPLARYFSDATMDIESGSNNMVGADSKPTLSIEDGKRGSERWKTDPHDSSNKENINRKYKALKSSDINTTTSNASLHTDTRPNMENGQPSKISSTWVSMKTNFQNLRTNMAAKRFMPLRQSQDTQATQESSSESLDEIFERLKLPSRDDRRYRDEDDYGTGPSNQSASR